MSPDNSLRFTNLAITIDVSLSPKAYVDASRELKSHYSNLQYHKAGI